MKYNVKCMTKEEAIEYLDKRLEKLEDWKNDIEKGYVKLRCCKDED